MSVFGLLKNVLKAREPRPLSAPTGSVEISAENLSAINGQPQSAATDATPAIDYKQFSSTRAVVRAALPDSPQISVIVREISATVVSLLVSGPLPTGEEFWLYIPRADNADDRVGLWCVVQDCEEGGFEDSAYITTATFLPGTPPPLEIEPTKTIAEVVAELPPFRARPGTKMFIASEPATETADEILGQSAPQLAPIPAAPIQTAPATLTAPVAADQPVEIAPASAAPLAASVPTMIAEPVPAAVAEPMIAAVAAPVAEPVAPTQPVEIAPAPATVVPQPVPTPEAPAAQTVSKELQNIASESLSQPMQTHGIAPAEPITASDDESAAPTELSRKQLLDIAKQISVQSKMLDRLGRKIERHQPAETDPLRTQMQAALVALEELQSTLKARAGNSKPPRKKRRAAPHKKVEAVYNNQRQFALPSMN